MIRARRALVTTLLAAAVSMALAPIDGALAAPAGGSAPDRWSLVSKDEAGLGAGSSFTSLAAGRSGLLLAGARPVEDDWQAAIWQSEDGLHWTESAHPAVTGQVDVVAFDGDTALAIGGTGRGVSEFVWRSEDRGRTWTVVASGSGVFGVPAPEMGRPSATGLLHHGDWWVASGGRSDGFAAIWISRDGSRWREVLGSNSAGGASIVEGTNGSLFAYWVDSGWSTGDPTSWGRPRDLTLPDRFVLSTVAPGATTGFGQDLDRHDTPTPLLRRQGRGRTWERDDSFLRAYPDAHVWTLARAGAHWVAAGTSGGPSHVDAWISTDRRTWDALPEALSGGSGGTLSLVATLRGRIVLVGTAPELDRYYTYDTRIPPG